MSTEAKNDTNRANAQFSTGPVTDAGKAISSRNALTHGLTAKTVLLPGEDPAEYQAFSDAILHDLDPLNTFEISLAAELIGLQWRILRVPGIEARILSAESPDMKALNNIGLQAARLKRQFSATLKEFQHMHDANRKTRTSDLEQAELIHCADSILKRPSTLADHGFDFTIEDVRKWRAQGIALRQAEAAVWAHNNPPKQAA